jgi:hypothetical protein
VRGGQDFFQLLQEGLQLLRGSKREGAPLSLLKGGLLPFNQEAFQQEYGVTPSQVPPPLSSSFLLPNPRSCLPAGIRRHSLPDPAFSFPPLLSFPQPHLPFSKSTASLPPRSRLLFPPLPSFPTPAVAFQQEYGVTPSQIPPSRFRLYSPFHTRICLPARVRRHSLPGPASSFRLFPPSPPPQLPSSRNTASLPPRSRLLVSASTLLSTPAFAFQQEYGVTPSQVPPPLSASSLLPHPRSCLPAGIRRHSLPDPAFSFPPLLSFPHPHLPSSKSTASLPPRSRLLFPPLPSFPTPAVAFQQEYGVTPSQIPPSWFRLYSPSYPYRGLPAGVGSHSLPGPASSSLPLLSLPTPAVVLRKDYSVIQASPPL